MIAYLYIPENSYKRQQEKIIWVNHPLCTYITDYGILNIYLTKRTNRPRLVNAVSPLHTEIKNTFKRSHYTSGQRLSCIVRVHKKKKKILLISNRFICNWEIQCGGFNKKSSFTVNKLLLTKLFFFFII